MGTILEVRNLHKAFGGVKAVVDVSFSLEEGDLMAMIGPNGAGKSTCFNLINGQLNPDQGSIFARCIGDFSVQHDLPCPCGNCADCPT